MASKTVALLIVLTVLFEIITVTVVAKRIKSQTIQFNKSTKPPGKSFGMGHVIKLPTREPKRCNPGYIKIDKVCYKIIRNSNNFW